MSCKSELIEPFRSNVLNSRPDCNILLSIHKYQTFVLFFLEHENTLPSSSRTAPVDLSDTIEYFTGKQNVRETFDIRL